LRKHSILALAVVAAAAFLVPSSPALTAPRVFSLLDVPDQNIAPIGGFTFDRPPVGGDQFAIQDTLYKWAGTKRGARTGRLRGFGTFQTGFGPKFQLHASVLFTVQAYLPGGSVLVQGFGEINPNGPSRFTIPVVGGTGVYANARGYVKVRDLGDGNLNRSNVDVHLLP
jgi:hypothetical protein